jgi:AraC-like DNA-binding protein
VSVHLGDAPRLPNATVGQATIPSGCQQRSLPPNPDEPSAAGDADQPVLSGASAVTTPTPLRCKNTTRATFPGDMPTKPKDRRIAAVLFLIEQKPGLGIPALAAFVHLSSSRLRCLFHAEMRVPLRQYLKQRRLFRAEHLLTVTFLSVKEVADLSGFGDVSHFIRDFHKAFSMSPRAFRSALVLPSTPYS